MIDPLWVLENHDSAAGLIEELEQQRDELLAALENVILAGMSGSRGMRSFLAEAKSALTKANARAAQAGEVV